MNKYLFLLDELPPTKSANGICVERVIAYLQNTGDVYCVSWNTEKINNDKVYFYQIKKKKWARKVEYLKANTTLLGKMIFLIARCMYKLKRIFMLPIWPVDAYSTVNDFYSLACDLINKENITHVIAVSYPGETLLAMKKLKKKYGKKIQTIMYPLDVTLEGMYEGTTIEKYVSKKCGRKFLIKCGEFADKIIVLENVEHLYKQYFPNDLQKRFKVCGIPMIEESNYLKNNKRIENSKISCVFGGNLFYDLRNPTPLLDMLEKQNKEIIFDIYGCADSRLWKEWENRYKNIKIVDHGWVSQDILNDAIEKTDILINIGNAEEHLIPSKLFKYMSVKKPILHQKVAINDPCVPYLEKYNGAFIFDTTIKVDEEKFDLDIFLKKDINTKSISQLFPRCTPQYTASIINESV
jgi:hypothetical protein